MSLARACSCFVLITLLAKPPSAGVVLVYTDSVKFCIPIAEKVSLNKIYAGVHWRKRREWAEVMHWMVLSARILPYDGPFPVDCRYHFFLHGKQLDSSNCAFLAKLVEDGLVHAKVIPDDSRQYVRWVSVLSSQAKKTEEQRVEVELSTGD